MSSHERSSSARREQAKDKAGSLTEQEARPTGLEEPSYGSIGRPDPDPIRSQAALLSDTRVPAAQRQRAAARIGRTCGNQSLQKVVSQVPGNRVQRRAVRGIIGNALGRITFRAPGYVPGEGELRVQTEVVPTGERPGRFAGYSHRIQALAQAWRQSTVCAIGEDREGRFHVLRTDWPRHSPQTRILRIVPYARSDHLFAHLWWVNAPSEGGQGAERGPGSWSQRVERARQWHSNWRRRTMPEDFPAACQHSPRHERTLDGLRQCLEEEFVDLLSQALDIGRDTIYVARSRGDRNPGALVTFDMEMIAVGRGGIGRLPTSRSGTVPRPSVAVGPLAFKSESRLHTLATVLHESEHFSHAARATELLERWRRSRSRSTFEDWLRRERGAGRISQVEYDLTIERVRNGLDATETLARLEAFTAVYHQLPITRTAYRWGQLDAMAGYWLRAGHQINEDSIRRLATYYRGLDQAHRADFAEHARRAQRTLRDAAAGLFWDRVVRDVLSP